MNEIWAVVEDSGYDAPEVWVFATEDEARQFRLDRAGDEDNRDPWLVPVSNGKYYTLTAKSE